jgi:type IV secretion system protein VirB5
MSSSVPQVSSGAGQVPSSASNPVVDQRVLHAELARWITCARSVVADRIAEKQNLDFVYSMVVSGSAARSYLDRYYPRHDPFTRAAKESASVSIDAILPIRDKAYLVDWTETTYDLSGHVTGKAHWEASVEIVFARPADEKQIESNPLGLFISSLTWTQKT